MKKLWLAIFLMLLLVVLVACDISVHGNPTDTVAPGTKEEVTTVENVRIETECGEATEAKTVAPEPDTDLIATTDSDTAVSAPETTEPVTEPETTEPVTEPETTEPVTEPETTEPVTEPETTEPVTEPETTEPVTEPETTEPVTEPETTEPVTEPETTEPVTEPETTEPVTEPETTEPATEPETTEPEETNYTVLYYDEDGITLLGSVTVEYGENAEYPNTSPTKESTDQYTYSFDKWVTVAGGTIEATLTNICENKSVYAKYTATTNKYTVIFCDWDGTVLDEQTVEYGSGATAPEDLERDGYRFDGWDKSYDNVTQDITVTANYVAVVEVKFIDYDSSVIYSEYIDLGSNFVNIPDNPTRSDYVFTSWSTNAFENIVEDLEVQAQYVRMYRVSFVDHNGSVLKTENVMTGTAATAPADPSREGYDFVGWDTEFSNITSNLKVTARYQIKRYTVTFVMPDGKVISVQENIKHGFSAEAPMVDGYYYDWNTRKGYKFTGWDKSIDSITASVTVTAVYDQEVTEPIIVVQSTSIPLQTTDVAVEVYICSNDKIYGISLDMLFDSTLKKGKDGVNVEVRNFEKNGKSPTYTSTITENSQYELRWTWGEGFDPNDYSTPTLLLTFNFSLEKYQSAGDYLVDILASTYIINEDLAKVTPVVISGTVTLGN